jgi:hypothetical protein
MCDVLSSLPVCGEQQTSVLLFLAVLQRVGYLQLYVLPLRRGVQYASCVCGIRQQSARAVRSSESCLAAQLLHGCIACDTPPIEPLMNLDGQHC